MRKLITVSFFAVLGFAIGCNKSQSSTVQSVKIGSSACWDGSDEIRDLVMGVNSPIYKVFGDFHLKCGDEVQYRLRARDEKQIQPTSCGSGVYFTRSQVSIDVLNQAGAVSGQVEALDSSYCSHVDSTEKREAMMRKVLWQAIEQIPTHQ